MKNLKIFLFFVFVFFAVTTTKVNADEVTSEVTINVITSDITCTPTSAPSSISAVIGVAKTLTSTCVNGGAASTGGTQFQIIMITATGSGGGGTRTTTSLGSNFGPLAANGGNVSVSMDKTFNSSGTYSYQTCADQSYKGETPGLIKEGSNEGNNCSWWTDISVPTDPVVTFNGNGSTSGSTGPQTISANSSTSLVINGFSRTGYSFSGWSTTSGIAAVSYANGANYSIGSSNVTLYAQWTVETYRLTVNKIGSGTVSSNPAGISCGADCSEVYNYNTSVVLTASASSNYSFGGWSGGGCSGSGNCTTTVDSSKTVTATFNIDTYSIVASTGGNGTVTPAGTTNVNYGSSQGYNINPSTGYHISSVLVDGVSQGAISTYTFNSVSSNHTISATFAINTYNIIASSFGSGTINPSGTTTKNYNTSQLYTMKPDAGYHISNVLVDGVSVGTAGTYTFSNISSNHTIVAQFAINTYNIIASSFGSGTINPSGTTTKNYNTSQLYTMKPDAGYHISNVLVDGVSVGTAGTYTFSNISSNHTIVAQFAINTYNIIASSSSNGTVTPTGTTVKDYGSSQVYSITPSANYHVLNVLVDGASVGAVSTYTFSSISADHTISATFTLDTFTLTSTKNGTGNGTVTSSPIGISCGADCSQVYDYGTSVTLTAAASLDSSFSGWSGGGCSGKGSCVMSVTSNQTVTATFTKIPVITSLTVSPDPVDFGTSTNISFTADYASNLCAIILDLDGGSPIWIGASGSHTANTGNLNVEGAHNASVACANKDNVFNPPYIISFIVSPDDIAPTISPITAIGETKFYATWNLQFNIEGNDADIGDKIHYVVDWMDGTPNTTTPTVVISSSGLPSYTRMTVNHTWHTTGSKTFRAQTVDLKGKTSAWEQFTFTAKILPPLPVIDLLQSNKLLNQIEFNDTVNIKWESSNADSCSMATNTAPGVNIISNFSDAQSLDNNKDFIPPQKTIYTLKCINDAGEANKSLPIMVGKMDPTITEF